MELEQLIKQTKTVQLSEEACDLSQEQIEHLLEIACFAPNHKLTQPWKMLILEKGAKRTEFLQFATQNMGDKAKSLQDKWVNVPYLVIFCAKSDADPVVAKENYATVCCSIQLFALQLRAKGYGYKWSTPKGFYQVNFAKYFDSTMDYQFVGVVTLGKEVISVPPRERPTRKPVQEFLGKN